MSQVAYVFAGQGSQTIGMGRELCETFAPARELFDTASQVLGFDLTKVCFEGPEETLNRTDVSQPAILVHSIAALKWFESISQVQQVVATAGLSLGEYSAHVHAGSLRLDDALRLVKLRGQFMQEACDQTPSGMVAVLKLDAAEVEAACREASGIVGIANYNAPGEIVISGEREALDRAAELCRKKGARRCVPLKVAGAYHSEVMRPAQERLVRELSAIKITAPRLPIYANVSAKPVVDPEEIRNALGRQICAPVRWHETIQAIGVGRYVEFGPGRILAGLIKKIQPEAEVVSVDKPDPAVFA